MKPYLMVFVLVVASAVVVGVLSYWLDKGVSRHERDGDS